MRIMGIDFGTKRMGVALSDELFITAQGADTIQRKDLKADLAVIADIVNRNNVIEIIVGLPISMNGTHSKKTEEVLEFVGILAKAVSVPIKTWDERLTTVQADRAMMEAGLNGFKRRRLADKVASGLILQSYLDSRKRG
ncbi:MAG: Holliday junction resolvase RuvX [Candidatus Omnitrophica bacterium]|nr:Holliday junction resolvase RuvX [Candidatus Omnitrophota bacterium]